MPQLLPGLEHDGTEKAVVLQNRFQEAHQAGLTDLQAAEFSISDTDVGLLRKLVEAHCDPALIARIVT